MLDPTELEELRDRRFALECPEITLTQRTTSSPRVLRGPGRLSQDDTGVLHFTVHARDVDWNPRSLFPTRTVGTLVPETEYFALEAVDLLNRRWQAERVDVDEDHSMPLRFSVAKGKVAPLEGWRSREPRPDGRFAMTGYLFRELRFPSNTRSTVETNRGRWASRHSSFDVAEFQVDGVELHIHQEPGTSVISASAVAGFPAAYSSRLLEALRFVVGEEFWWDVLCEYTPDREHATIYHRADSRHAGIMPEPIPTNHVKSFESITELFACYLRYALQAPDPNLLHWLSAEWGEILRAGRGTLQTQATILCIAVEPILRGIFSERQLEIERDRTALALVRKWSARLREVLEAEGCPEDLRRRFEGLFSPMPGLSDRDRLAWLAARGAIDPSLAQRWQRLRPVSAHGNRAAQGEDDPLFNECMAVLSLLYQLVAYLIGYRGYLRAFADQGWPLRPYPIVLQAGPAAEA